MEKGINTKLNREKLIDSMDRILSFVYSDLSKKSWELLSNLVQHFTENENDLEVLYNYLKTWYWYNEEYDQVKENCSQN